MWMQYWSVCQKSNSLNLGIGSIKNEVKFNLALGYVQSILGQVLLIPGWNSNHVVEKTLLERGIFYIHKQSSVMQSIGILRLPTNFEVRQGGL